MSTSGETDTVEMAVPPVAAAIFRTYCGYGRPDRSWKPAVQYHEHFVTFRFGRFLETLDTTSTAGINSSV